MHNPNDVSKHAAGELAEQGGIVAGTVQQFAEALDTTPAAVVGALTKTPCVNDTAHAKGRTQGTRPKDPTRRSLAFTMKQFARLHATIITDE